MAEKKQKNYWYGNEETRRPFSLISPFPKSKFKAAEVTLYLRRHRILLGSTGFYWVLRGLVVFYWVLLGFIGFYWVLLGFIGFLPGFTLFYRL